MSVLTVLKKQMQREDWRLRPLPQDMVQYARTDACYLLYVAHCLVGELKQKNNGIIFYCIDFDENSSFLSCFLSRGEFWPNKEVHHDWSEYSFET